MTHSLDTTRAFVIPSGSVGLDSMSSVDVFGDERLLTNIRKVTRRMKIVCNAGSVVVDQMEGLKGYSPVWFHPGAIENILLLHNAKRVYKVVYDSNRGDFFTLQKPGGSARIFKQTSKGLYFSQVINPESNVVLVTTVEQNLKEYTQREVKAAR